MIVNCCTLTALFTEGYQGRYKVDSLEFTLFRSFKNGHWSKGMKI